MNTLKQGFKGLDVVSHAAAYEWKVKDEKYRALLVEIAQTQSEVDDASKFLAAAIGQNQTHTQTESKITNAIEKVKGVLKELQELADLCGAKSSSGEIRANKASWFYYDKRASSLYDQAERVKGNLRAARLDYMAEAHNDIMKSMNAMEGAVTRDQSALLEALKSIQDNLENNTRRPDPLPEPVTPAADNQVSTDSSNEKPIEKRPVRVFPMDDPIWQYLGNVEKLRMMLENGLIIFPDDQSDDGYEIMEVVIKSKHYEALEVLLKKWSYLLPRKRLSRRIGYTIRNALDDNPTDLEASLLRKVGSYVDDDWESPDPKLHTVVASGDLGEVEKALGELDDLSAIDDLGTSGYSPLHIAAMKGHVHIVQILAEAGADINRKSFNGSTPLIAAVHAQKFECIRRLLQLKCRSDDCGNDGLRPIDYAAVKGCVDSIKLLVEEPYTQPKNIWGFTPMHFFAMGPEVCPPGIIDLLKRVSLRCFNDKDHKGRTPLEWALMNNNLPVVRGLIEAGSPLKFPSGQNVLHYAAAYSNLEVLQYLFDQKLSAMDHEVDPQANSWSSKRSWKIFRSCISYSPWELETKRCPNVDEQKSFIRLCQDIRRRNLNWEKEGLEKIQPDCRIHPDECYLILSKLRGRSLDSDGGPDIYFHLSSSFFWRKEDAERIRDRLEYIYKQLYGGRPLCSEDYADLCGYIGEEEDHAGAYGYFQPGFDDCEFA